MGTNYYYCPCCGQSKQRIHIGKSSCGWRFNFDGADLKTMDIDKIKEKLKYGNIENEYGDEVSFDEFWEMVENKQKENEARSQNDKYIAIIDSYEISNTTFS